MVVLISLFQPAQDSNGALLVGFIDHDDLETAFEGLVLLKVFLVLVECGGTDTAQVSTGQSGLEDVCGVHGTTALAGTHQSVDFVDEQDNLSLGLSDFVNDRFESFLKFSLIFCTCNQCAHVERIDLLPFQVLRYITTYDALRQSLYDGSLAGSRLSDENGVVFRSTTQNL